MTEEQMTELKRHFGVVAEALRRDLQQVAEGVTNLDEKVDRALSVLQSANEAAHREIVGLLRVHEDERHT